MAVCICGHEEMEHEVGYDFDEDIGDEITVFDECTVEDCDCKRFKQVEA